MRFLVFLYCFAGLLLRTYAQSDLALETVVQTGHYEPINALKYSPDGRFLISGGQDNSIKLWELRTGREIRTFSGSTLSILEIDFSPDGEHMVSVNKDSSAWIWELESGKVLRKLKTNDDIINNAIFSRDGNTVYTGSKEYNITAWSLETGEILWREVGEKIGCYSRGCKVDMELNSKGDLMLTAVSDYSTLIWDLQKREVITKVKGTRYTCSSCMASGSFAPDAKSFVAFAREDSIRIWDTRTGKLLNKIPSMKRIEKLKVSANGKFIAAVANSVIKLYDFNSGKELYSEGKYLDGVNTMAFSPDGRSLAMAGDNKTIAILNLPTLRITREFSGVVNVFEDSLGSQIKYWVNNKHAQTVSPDGKIVARGKIGNSARLWDVETGRILRDLEGHLGPVIDLTFSPDGKHIATAGGDGKGIIWDVETGEMLHELVYHRDILFSIKYNLKGTRITTTSWDGRVALWDAKTGKPLFRYRPHEGNAAYVGSLTPNGLYVISAGLDQKLLMLELDTGTPVKEFIGHSFHVTDIEFSPDGNFMMTSSIDGLAKLWNLNTTYQVGRFEGHEGSIYDVDFSKDGKLAATAGRDKTAKVWDIESGDLMLNLVGHLGAVTSVSFNPAGDKLYTASRDGTTKCWDLQTGKEIFTHIFTGEKDWMVKVPSGHFYATDGARQSVFFVRGTESFNIERFFDDYFKPGLLESTGIKERDGERINLLDKLEQFPPPEIEMIAPTPPYPSNPKTLDLMFRVINTGGGIEEIKITQNGKRIIDDKSDLEKITKKGKSIVKVYSVDLVPGRNDIRISAFSNGRIESEEQKIELLTEGDVPLAACHIFAIGINKYQNPRLNLNYAEADAGAFVNELKKRGKKLYDKVHVYSLMNEDATRENILKTVAELQETVGPNDVFYFFYAGHGSLVDNTFYFIPTEVTRLYDKDALESGAISAESFKSQLQEIKALKQVMVLDACHSGGSTEILAERGAAEEKALAQLSRSAGIHVLAAAGSEQTAAEFKELGHGLFTYMILEALSGKADGAPLDDKVTVYELKSFLDDQVPDYSQKYKGSPQYPSTFSRGHDFPLTLGKSAEGNN